MKPGIGKAILLTGLLVGTLDAGAAIVNFIIPAWRNPIRIFQYIASGVFGRDIAFADPLVMPLLGLIFHYIIAVSWTAAYFLAYPKLKLVWKNTVLGGVAYGAVVWALMNLIVLPLSRVPAGPLRLAPSITGMLILMVMVGLPVAFRANHFYQRKS